MTIKNRVKYLICLLSFIIVLFAGLTLTLPKIAVGEENNNLIISYEENTKVIKNIQNYLNSNSLYRNGSTIKENNYLKELQFTDDEISKMKDDEKQIVFTAEYAKVATITYKDTIIDDQSQTYSDKMKMVSRIYRSPRYDKNGVKAFLLSVSASWINMPTTRNLDVLAITATNDSVYGPKNERGGSWSCLRQTNTGSGSYGYSTETTNNQIEEYSFEGYAIRFNLPNNASGFGRLEKYTLLTASIRTTIYNNSPFNIYSAYGHKYIGTEAEISSGGGVSIKFGSSVTNYAGPLLAVI